MEPINVTSASVTVTAMSSKPQPAFKNPNDVEFEVKYPENYKGKRFMPEGRVTISKESAEKFETLGIGKVVEATAEPVIDETVSIDQSKESSGDQSGKQKSTSKSKSK